MSAWKHCPHCLRGYTGPVCRCGALEHPILPREQALLDAALEATMCLSYIGHRDGTLRKWADKASAASRVLSDALAAHRAATEPPTEENA